MKRLILVMLLCGVWSEVWAQEKDSLLVVFWNVETFFDWTDQGTGESDKEFSSYGTRYWTKSRFYTKCDQIAKALMWISERYGCMPDVIGLAEVENSGVLTKLLEYTLLRKYDYSIVHKESGDRRGIDVALLYRKSSMILNSKTFIAPIFEGKKMATRDILHARMKVSNGIFFDFIVNHHPSKYGGAKESEDRRNAVMSTLRHICDSLKYEDIIAMGDFNDTPNGSQFKFVNDVLSNKGLVLHDKGEGTIRYKGKWELIDFFLTGSDLSTSAMSIERIPFLTTYEKRYPGEKPLRTYSGPRYLGGVSDHYPVSIWIYFIN